MMHLNTMPVITGLMAFLVLVLVVIAAMERAERDDLRDRLRDFEGLDECCCNGLEPVVDDMKTAIDRALELMQRGFPKDARHELERALEDAEAETSVLGAFH